MQTYALAVGDILLSRFGLRHVLVRSTQTPADRLLLVNSNQPSLFVVLGPATSSTSILETESAAPIITLTASNDVATTALAIAKCCSLASPVLQQIVQQVVLENRQARLVQDAQLRTSSPLYATAMATCYDQKLQMTGDSLQSAMRGKVRDRFELPNPQLLALVTTDRQSGFDRMLAMVPFKGAVLNLTSAFWFEQTKSIIPNHLVAVPHPYISVCRKCKPFPIEFVVRYVFFHSMMNVEFVWRQFSLFSCVMYYALYFFNTVNKDPT